jgi:hypothetical protein
VRVQQHVDEAMQPDGIDLEYVYVQGVSRPQSPVHNDRAPSGMRGAARGASALGLGSRAGHLRPHSASAQLHKHMVPSSVQQAQVHHRTAVHLPAGSAPGTWVERPRSAMLPPRTHAHVRSLQSVWYPWDDSLAGMPPRRSAQQAQQHSRPCSAGARLRGVHGGKGTGMAPHAASNQDADSKQDADSNTQLAQAREVVCPVGRAPAVDALQHAQATRAWLEAQPASLSHVSPPQSDAGSIYRRHQRLSNVGGSYSQQLSALVARANTLSADLGSKYRYVAMQQKRQQTAAGNQQLVVERRLVSVRCCFLTFLPRRVPARSYIGQDIYGTFAFVCVHGHAATSTGSCVKLDCWVWTSHVSSSQRCKAAKCRSLVLAASTLRERSKSRTAN